MSNPAVRLEAPRALAQRYRFDGVIHLPKVLEPGMLKLARQGFDWSLANPSSAAQQPFPQVDSAFYHDLFNTASWPLYDVADMPQVSSMSGDRIRHPDFPKLHARA